MNGPHQSHSTRYGFSDEIPDRYEEPILLVLPCNPFRLYVYWEHPAITADVASQWFLRYFIDTKQSGSNNSSDDFPEIKISSPHGEWFLDVPVPGVHYTVELVQKKADGGRVLLLRTGYKVPAAADGAHAAPIIQCRSADRLITASAVQRTTPADTLPDVLHKSTTTPLVAPAPCRSPSSWALQIPPSL